LQEAANHRTRVIPASVMPAPRALRLSWATKACLASWNDRGSEQQTVRRPATGTAAEGWPVGALLQHLVVCRSFAGRLPGCRGRFRTDQTRRGPFDRGVLVGLTSRRPLRTRPDAPRLVSRPLRSSWASARDLLTSRQLDCPLA
jgi:hypothetical protein